MSANEANKMHSARAFVNQNLLGWNEAALGGEHLVVAALFTIFVKITLMGGASTKATSQSGSKRKSGHQKQLRIEKNPLFAEMANIETIVYVHFALLQRFPGLPKELLPAILLLMPRYLPPVVSSKYTLSSLDIPRREKVIVLGNPGGT